MMAKKYKGFKGSGYNKADDKLPKNSKFSTKIKKAFKAVSTAYAHDLGVNTKY